MTVDTLIRELDSRTARMLEYLKRQCPLEDGPNVRSAQRLIDWAAGMSGYLTDWDTTRLDWAITFMELQSCSN